MAFDVSDIHIQPEHLVFAHIWYELVQAVMGCKVSPNVIAVNLSRASSFIAKVDTFLYKEQCQHANHASCIEVIGLPVTLHHETTDVATDTVL